MVKYFRAGIQDKNIKSMRRREKRPMAMKTTPDVTVEVKMMTRHRGKGNNWIKREDEPGR
jgi:hypothetical protein